MKATLTKVSVALADKPGKFIIDPLKVFFPDLVFPIDKKYRSFFWVKPLSVFDLHTVVVCWLALGEIISLSTKIPLYS